MNRKSKGHTKLERRVKNSRRTGANRACQVGIQSLPLDEYRLARREREKKLRNWRSWTSAHRRNSCGKDAKTRWPSNNCPRKILRSARENSNRPNCRRVPSQEVGTSVWNQVEPGKLVFLFIQFLPGYFIRVFVFCIFVFCVFWSMEINGRADMYYRVIP